MDPFELCVSSDLEHLARIAEFVTQCARGAGLSETGVFEIQMAADEACTNAIQHAYSGRAGEVRVCCWVAEGDFCVRITDFGERFDPALIPLPDTTAPLESRDIGGLGLYFMRALTDRIEFAADQAQGNQVTLRKRLPSLP